MLKYILKRLGLSILILLGVSLILYFLIRCMPVDFIQSKIDAMNQGGATIQPDAQVAMYTGYGMDVPADVAEEYMNQLRLEGRLDELEKFQKEYGNDSEIIKMFRGYLGWLVKICKLDFGTSFKYGIPVVDVIKDNMGVSFLIALIATIFEFMIAIPLGITAATHQYSVRDYIVTILVMIGISLPAFFFGQVLKNLLSMQLGWLPPSGWVDATKDMGFVERMLDIAKHAVLPILTVVILSIGGRMRMTRTNMLEVMNSDYIRTARAKGLKERTVIYKHAFRNTLIPLVTSLAGLLPSLFSGAIITEQVFDLPGIGNIALKAMSAGDIPFIMGYNMFLALLSVIGVLLADLMYAVVDPRVKLS